MESRTEAIGVSTIGPFGGAYWVRKNDDDELLYDEDHVISCLLRPMLKKRMDIAKVRNWIMRNEFIMQRLDHGYMLSLQFKQPGDKHLHEFEFTLNNGRLAAARVEAAVISERMVRDNFSRVVDYEDV